MAWTYIYAAIDTTTSGFTQVSYQTAWCQLLEPGLVSANHWSRGIETYTFLWYLTMVGANHASSDLGVVAQVVLKESGLEAAFPMKKDALNFVCV